MNESATVTQRHGTPAHEELCPADRVSAKAASRPNRVGLFGLFGIGNFGNDGSLECVLRLIRRERPQDDIVCICSHPDKIEARFSVRSVALDWRPGQGLSRFDRMTGHLLREAVSLATTMRQLASLDVLIIPGTGMLDDFGSGPMGIPYRLFQWCIVARALGTKVVFVSIGAGPIHHPLSRRFMKSAAAVASYRSYRDGISRDFMGSLGLDVGNDPVNADVAFVLPAGHATRAPSETGQPITVGVGLMTYNGWHASKGEREEIYEAYLEKMRRFIGWLLARGHRVRLLMGDDADRRTVEAVARMFDGEERLVSQQARTLQDVMAQIADTDVVVATRYHNVVCALHLGRPTLSIGYAGKNDALLSAMGLGELCQQIEHLDVDRLMRQFETMVEGRKDYERGIAEGLERFRAGLLQQEALLVQHYL